MSAVQVLIRTRFASEHIPVVQAHVAEMSNRLSEAKGFRGISAWRKIDTPQAFIFIVAYDDSDCAREAVKLVEGVPLPVEELGFRGQGAPDIMILKEIASEGLRAHEAAVGTIMSLSIRLADPGLERELLRDYEVIFEESKFLDGFAGYAYGTRVGLDEEVLGIAFWHSLKSYESSLPKKMPIVLRVYRKAF